MNSLYVAGRFGAQERLRGVAADLGKMGYTVTSRWLTEPGAPRSTAAGSEVYDLNAYAVTDLKAYAVRDVGDIQRANCFVLDTLDESTTGGREVELGIALALGKPCLIVGPPRNVFHHLVTGLFETWEDAYAFLETIRQPPSEPEESREHPVSHGTPAEAP